jgi:hypothetical protein
MDREKISLRIDQDHLRRMDQRQRVIFVDLLSILNVQTDSCQVTQTWVDSGTLLGRDAGPTLRSMIDDGHLEIEARDGGYVVKLLPIEREEKPFKEEEGAEERKRSSTGSTVVKTGSTSSSSSVGSSSWEDVAKDLIEKNGQTFNEVYLQKTIEALASLGETQERASRVLARGLNEDTVRSLPGWITTTGKSMLKKTAATDNHPMYQKYAPDETQPPAGNLEVKAALANMKEICLEEERKALARKARQEDSDNDGGDTEDGGTPGLPEEDS